MTQSALEILIVAIVILVVIAVAFALMQRSRLRPLPDELKDRYAQSWRAIESRFVENPEMAISEADQLAVAVLRDRGARMDDEKHLPDKLVHAREIARSDEGQASTEGRRKAILEYKAIVYDALGRHGVPARDKGRKEVA